MCDDHSGLSRRQFLGGTAATLAAGAILVPPQSRPRVPARLGLRHPARPQDGNGNSAWSNAMHIHSSFSEFGGSMAAHAHQATINGCDTIWWTDHDQRIGAVDYRKTVHFTSLTQESGAPGEGSRWIWQKKTAGALASSAGGIVTSPCSPNDPVAGGALHVSAQASGTGTASVGYFADSHPADLNYHDSLAGQSLSIDVRPGKGWTRGYLEVLIEGSEQAPAGTLGAGRYDLSYRLAPGATAGRASQGTLGVVTIPVKPDEWQTITITPQEDVAALWPAFDSRDFAIAGLTLSAVSQGDKAGGYFDYLRFDRSISGEAAFQMQADMMTTVASRYPDVSQQQALEVSGVGVLPHCNWFGPGMTLLDYGAVPSAQWAAELHNTLIPQIHQAGGLVSYNHPYGTGHEPLLSASAQDSLMQQMAVSLLGSNVLGADLLEVGYPSRGGVDLAHHAGLWDVMSRNAIFLTGDGVSDDHVGNNWAGLYTNWVTSTWAPTVGLADQMAALAAGRAWCGSLTKFPLPSGAALDLEADGTCPMGSVSLSALTSRQLTVTCTGLPSGGSLQVLQGAVDYAGTASPSPDTTVVASYDAGTLDGNGQATQAVDTSSESFVRTQVLDSAGTVVALSNPVWLLHNTPPGGIPVPRQA